MLFQKNIIKKYLATLPLEDISQAWDQYKSYFLNPAIQQNILQSKEEQFQEGFLRELFVKILGYTLNPSPDYNLITEQKNEANSKKADGAILLDGKVIGIIELKDHKTTDLAKIEAQAFGYKSQHVGTRLVIISNFEKLRLYIDNAVEHREWNLFSLNEDEFRELYLCLAWPQVKAGIALQMKSESVSNEDQITKSLYKDYSQFKRVLFADIVEHNPDYDKLLLFKKTQKLLDRLLFIFFAEDCGLLPPNSMMQIIDQWEKLKEMDEYRPLYDRVKKYFGYMNTGFQGKKYEIFAYNGGLFKPDEVLDNIIISDEPLVEHTKRLSTYDFESEVDVNILGHIFENSLSEIEEITETLSSETRGHAPLHKRKQDGVFYTPQYITKYIVENTVGRLCAEKKSELGIVDEEYFSDQKRQKQTRKRLMEQLQQYREWLLQITICDPACGSGAFLNAALQFLMNEHRLIDEMEAKVTGASIVFQDVENSILENNLFGVDINEESVEIAQLALWLRTAKPHRKLNTLSQNIKCGNSLVSDPAIAGDKAFNWQEQFPKVFRKKQKRAWHITTATHDSRTSQRMIDYKVRLLRDHGMRPYADPMWLDPMEEKIVTETVAEIVKADGLNVLAYNVCGDHMHLVLVCEEEEVSKIVGKIKSMTARAVNIAMGRTTAGHAPLSRENDAPTDSGTAGHAPLSRPTRGETQCSLWTRKFGCVELDSAEYLYNAIEYVKNNRKKHGLPPLGSDETAGSGNGRRSDNREDPPAIDGRVCAVPTVSVEEAFRPEYDGGFDVVIGNPPYIPTERIEAKDKAYYEKSYKSAYGRINVYPLFYEKGITLLKDNGFLGFITPYTLLKNQYYVEARKYILDNSNILCLADFSGCPVFEDATVDSIILVLRKQHLHDAEPFLYINNMKDFATNQYTTQMAKQSGFMHNPDFSFSNIGSSFELNRVSNGCIRLGDIVNFKQGIITGNNKKFLTRQVSDKTKKVITGSDFNRYLLNWSNNYVVYDEKELHRPRVPEIFEVKEKLLLRQTGSYPICMIDTNAYYTLDTVHNGSILDERFNIKYILCLINSKLHRFIYESSVNESGKVFAQVKIIYIEPLPIKDISIESQQPFISLADTMLTLNAELQQKRSRFLRRLQENFCGVKITGTLETFDTLSFAHFLKELKKQKIKLTLPQQDEWEDYFSQYKTECNSISEQIAETDKKIDGMVYELYGLTEEEIKVVEWK